MANRITAEQIERMRELRASGMTVAHVAKQLGIADASVKKHSGDITVSHVQRAELVVGCRFCGADIPLVFPSRVEYKVVEWFLKLYVTCSGCGQAYAGVDLATVETIITALRAMTPSRQRLEDSPDSQDTP